MVDMSPAALLKVRRVAALHKEHVSDRQINSDIVESRRMSKLVVTERGDRGGNDAASDALDGVVLNLIHEGRDSEEVIKELEHVVADESRGMQ